MKKFLLLAICGLFSLTLVGCGSKNKENESKDEQPNTKAKEDINDYKGVWKTDASDVPNEELVITSIEDNKIKFDYLIHKIGSFEDVEATLEGDIATYNVKNTLGWTIEGTFKMSNGKVVFNIDKSSDEVIQTGNTTFKFKGEKSALKGDINKVDTTIVTKDYSDYKGVWKRSNSSIPDEEVVISSIEGTKVTFDYLVYKIGSFEKIEAVLDDNVATFNAKNTLGWTISGTLKFNSNKVILTIKECSNADIGSSSFTLGIKTDKSILR